jgi:hypothetical protein
VVREPRVAVRAAKFAADVGIEGPPAHTGCGGRVEDGSDIALDESGTAGTLIEYAEPACYWHGEYPQAGQYEQEDAGATCSPHSGHDGRDLP